MVLKFVAKLFLVTLCVTNAFCAPDKTPKPAFEITKNFNEKFITTPPKSKYDVYTVAKDFRDGGEVRLNVTTDPDDLESCVQFDYYVDVPESTGFQYGLKLAYIDAVTRETQIRWAKHGNTGDFWRTASLLVRSEKDQFLQFQAKVPVSDAVVGFTQFRYDKTKAACKMLPFNSDFEDESSGWDADVSVANRVHGRLRDRSSDSIAGNVAVLESGSKMILRNTLNKNGAKCLTFWYNQYQEHYQELVSRPFAVHLNGKSIWRSSAEVQVYQTWVRAAVPLDLISERNHFTIEAEVDKTEVKANVIIDDIEFTEAACPEPVSCSFTDSKCDWTDAYVDVSGKWQLGNGRVLDDLNMDEYKKGFMPLADQSTLYTDFTKYRPTQKEPMEIRSGLIPSNQDYCATIDILHNRVNISDSFELSMIEENGVNSKQRPLWQMDIAKAAKADVNKYHAETHQVTVPASQLPRRLAFGVHSRHALSRFAVKNIKIDRGECQTEVTESPVGKSKLPRETLIVADEFMKNSMENIQRIIDLIKVDDPIKELCVKLLAEMKVASQQIKQNL